MKTNVLLVISALLVSSCAAQQEVQRLPSSVDQPKTMEVVERMLMKANYEPKSEDPTDDGAELVITPWRPYPPKHEANGPYYHRVAAIITKHHGGGAKVALRIDVQKCNAEPTGSRCARIDRMFDSDTAELNKLVIELRKDLDQRAASVQRLPEPATSSSSGTVSLTTVPGSK